MTSPSIEQKKKQPISSSSESSVSETAKKKKRRPIKKKSLEELAKEKKKEALERRAKVKAADTVSYFDLGSRELCVLFWTIKIYAILTDNFFFVAFPFFFAILTLHLFFQLLQKRRLLLKMKK